MSENSVSKTRLELVTLEKRVEVLETNVSISLDKILEKQDEMAEDIKESHKEIKTDISKIKEAVYNPEKGLYARVTKAETEISAVKKEEEDSKKQKDKFKWIIISGIIGLALSGIGGCVTLLLNA